MPKIKQIESQIRTAGPAEYQRIRGEDLGGLQQLSALSPGLAKAESIIEKVEERSEVSDLAAKMSKAQADFSIHWAETLKTADPGDKELTSKFMKGYDDYMAKIGEEVSTPAGRDYFVKTNANMRGHFLTSSFAGQAELAGVKARQDYLGSVNNLSNSLFANPSSFEQVRDLHDSNLEELVKTGRMSRAAALDLKGKGNAQIAEASLRGWTNVNPDYAKQQLDSGRYDSYLNEDQKQQMYGEIERGIRGKEAEIERQKRLKEEELKQARMETENVFVEKAFNKDLTAKEILNSNLDARQKEHYINMIKQGSKETDPALFRDLLTRINLDDGDPRKIIDEADLIQYASDGRLAYGDLKDLRAEIQGKRTGEGSRENQAKNSILKMAEAALVKVDPILKIQDPDGLANYQKFVTFYFKEWDKQRKAGKTIEQLTDPRSPEWLGKYLNDYKQNPMSYFKKSADRLRSNTTVPEAVTTKPTTPESSTKRLPGESISDWRKRTGN